MQAKLDHVVLWVTDPLRSLEFYEKVVGLAPLRVPLIHHMIGVQGTAGNLVNHVCFAMSHSDVEALRKRLADAGVSVSTVMTNSFGARGVAPEAFYFRDPDNNVIEARFYE